MNNRGYSLVEITVAAVVFSVSIASVFASVSSFRKPVADSTTKLRAAQLSKKILEGLRQRVADPEHPDLDAASPWHGTSGSPRTDPEFPGYEYWYRVQNLGGTNVKQVEITVRTPP
jgi:type II secretory pathway pseudopilin PulG